MKKTLPRKKLVVSPMTIRLLTEPDFGAIAGGEPPTDSLVSFKPQSCSSCPRYSCTTGD